MPTRRIPSDAIISTEGPHSMTALDGQGLGGLQMLLDLVSGNRFRTHDINLPAEGPPDPSLPPSVGTQLRKAFDGAKQVNKMGKK